MDKTILTMLFSDLYKSSDELEKEKFTVKDLSSANWCIAKIEMAAQRMAEREAFAKEAIEKIKDYLEKANKEDEETIDRMKYFLYPYAQKEIEGVKGKSIKLLSGRVGFRKIPESIELPDTIVGLAKQLGIKVEIKEYVTKKAVKEYIKKTGHVPAGVIVNEGAEKFYVDLT